MSSSCTFFANFAVKIFNRKGRKGLRKVAKNLRCFAPQDSRGRLSHVVLSAFSNGAEEAFAFQVQNDLLRRLFWSQIRRVDHNLSILRFFVRI